MSWRVIATVVISIFVILLVSVATAGPLVLVTDTIVDAHDDRGAEDSRFDVEGQADGGVRAYSDLMPLLIFGVIAWAGWWILRRELTEGRL